MNKIPVAFTFEGKEYKGTLDEVSGVGAAVGSVWHLMVDQYYKGQLHYYQDRGFVFNAQHNSEAMAHLAKEFGELIIAWYG